MIKSIALAKSSKEKPYIYQVPDDDELTNIWENGNNGYSGDLEYYLEDGPFKILIFETDYYGDGGNEEIPDFDVYKFDISLSKVELMFDVPSSLRELSKISWDFTEKPDGFKHEEVTTGNKNFPEEILSARILTTYYKIYVTLHNSYRSTKNYGYIHVLKFEDGSYELIRITEPILRGRYYSSDVNIFFEIRCISVDELIALTKLDYTYEIVGFTSNSVICYFPIKILDMNSNTLMAIDKDNFIPGLLLDKYEEDIRKFLEMENVVIFNKHDVPLDYYTIIIVMDQ